jgi:hypothetical protein
MTCLPVRNAALSRSREGAGVFTVVGVASIRICASLSAMMSVSRASWIPWAGMRPTVPFFSLVSSRSDVSRPRGSMAAPLESITPTNDGERPCLE